MILKKVLWLIIVLLLAACGVVPAMTPVVGGQLKIIEYPIDKLPEPESSGLQEILHAVRQDARFLFDKDANSRIDIPFCTVGGIQGICAKLGSDDLFAHEEYDQAGNGQVTVYRQGIEICHIPVGMASPLTSLRGLWIYDGHWVLETVYVETLQDGDNISLVTKGQIIQDGVLLNERYNYDEMYEFQLLDGKPFYLFRQGVNIDYNFNGNEVNLGYTQIVHYGCCSNATLNPVHHIDHLDFFAQKGDVWYFVEIRI